MQITFDKGDAFPVKDEQAVSAILADLERAKIGFSATAQRDLRHWVRATKVDNHWRIDVRRGGWWTRQRLTPGDVTRDFWPIIALRDRGQFKADEVRRVFQAFVRDEKLPFPILGAG